METNEHENILEDFFNKSQFSLNGAVITDLDGTAVHEYEGLTIIHKEVETGLKKIYELGRPVIINSLRFPLSVIRTFADAWYKISAKPIPVVLLNGSQLGYIHQVQDRDQFIFEQIRSFPMHAVEIREIISTINTLQKDLITGLILFLYPEDWTAGEIIWTPHPDHIPALQKKYRSASSVISTSVAELEVLLLKQPVCMILLLVEAEDDRLMAYQHTKRSNFITHDKVDKLSGTIEMCRHLGVNLEDSVCAGDSPMDVFLHGAGLSVHVYNNTLPFKGKLQTLRLKDYHEYGQLLGKLASMQKKEISNG